MQTGEGLLGKVPDCRDIGGKLATGVNALNCVAADRLDLLPAMIESEGRSSMNKGDVGG